MGHAIPKIEYNVVAVTGDTTNTDATVTDIDTSDLIAGMYVRGTGITVGTTISSITNATELELSAPATATGNNVALEFFKKIEFDYPPIEELGERRRPQERISSSLSGVRQVSIDFIEGVRNLKFSFLTNTLYLAVKAFYDDWAVYGQTFRYYDDKTLSSYVEYELRDLDFDPVKRFPKGTNYVWDIPFNFRRVI